MKTRSVHSTLGVLSIYMKKLFFATCGILISLVLLAQTEEAGNGPKEPADSTGFGTADGNAVNREIGTGGGSIISEDGRIQLIFPAGSLKTTTTISIQPVTNLAPNGSGKSYRFTPSGIQFQKPVQLVFQYSDEESEACPPDWMSLAMQDEDGKWTFTDYEHWDSVAKTLTAYIHHFSHASNVYNLKLDPVRSELGVNRMTFVELLDITKLRKKKNPTAFIDPNTPVVWYVNDELNGSVLYGRIKASEHKLFNDAKWVAAKYTAPNQLPNRAVTVKAEIFLKSKTPGMRPFISLTCRIEIYDEYEFSFLTEFDNTSMGPGTLRLMDTATCIFKVKNLRSARGSKGSFLFFTQKITNTPCIIEKYNVPPNCSYQFTNTANCIGPINLVGLEEITMPAERSPDLRAKAFFTATMGRSPSIELTCHGRTKTIPSMPFHAFPGRAPISFNCSDEEQVQEGKEGPIRYKIRIRRVYDKAPSPVD